jgi:hypothetical protein
MPQISGLLIADEHEKRNTFLQETTPKAAQI